MILTVCITELMTSSDYRSLAVLPHMAEQQHPGQISPSTDPHDLVQHLHDRPIHLLLTLQHVGTMLGSHLSHRTLLLHRCCDLLRLWYPYLPSQLPLGDL